MGDWIEKSHWLVCADERAALEIYERLEHVASIIRRDGEWTPEEDGIGGVSVLRFGFGSPRLVVAIASQKWGESPELAEELVRGLPGARCITSTDFDQLIGDISAFEGEFCFLWSASPQTLGALGDLGLEAIRFGAARVHRLDTERAHVCLASTDPNRIELRLPDDLARAVAPEDTLVLGIASRAHGLVALGGFEREDVKPIASTSAVPMQLYAQRIEGRNNSVVIRDRVPLLPESLWLEEVTWKMERHGPLMLWQPLEHRQMLLREALASKCPSEQHAARAMMRRFALEQDGTRKPPAKSARIDWLDKVARIARAQPYVDALRGAKRSCRDAATRLFRTGALIDALADASRVDRLRELAPRLAELAHATSRSSYWMVRDGAPGLDSADQEHEDPLAIWNGNSTQIADQIRFWAALSALAMRQRDSTPSATARAAFLALDAAIDVALEAKVWRLPTMAWIEAALCDEFVTPREPSLEPSHVDLNLAHQGLALLLEGDALVTSDPARARQLLECARGVAKRANAKILTMRAAFRVLACLDDPDDAPRMEEELLSEFPMPTWVTRFSRTSAFLDLVMQWTVNAVARRAYENGDPNRCLDIIDRALVFAGDDALGHSIVDAKTRALLATGRCDEAYALLDGFADISGKTPFADIVESGAYRAWRLARRLGR